MLLKVLVKPGSKRGPLVEEKAEGITVFLREKPHDGEANEALIRLLAEHYNVAKSCVEIRSGGRSHQKTIEIIGK